MTSDDKKVVLWLGVEFVILEHLALLTGPFEAISLIGAVVGVVLFIRTFPLAGVSGVRWFLDSYWTMFLFVGLIWGYILPNLAAGALILYLGGRS